MEAVCVDDVFLWEYTGGQRDRGQVCRLSARCGYYGIPNPVLGKRRIKRRERQ